MSEFFSCIVDRALSSLRGRICTVASIIVCLEFCGNILGLSAVRVSAQTVTAIKLSDSSQILGHLNSLKSNLQQSRLTEVRSYLGAGVTQTDLNDTSFASWFTAMLTRLPDRDLIVKNPRLAALGPLWDFQIQLDSLRFYADSLCVANCTFSLRAAGTRRQPGTVLFTKRNQVWFVTGAGGICALLRAESLFLSATLKQGKAGAE